MHHLIVAGLYERQWQTVSALDARREVCVLDLGGGGGILYYNSLITRHKIMVQLSYNNLPLFPLKKQTSQSQGKKPTQEASSRASHFHLYYLTWKKTKMNSFCRVQC